MAEKMEGRERPILFSAPMVRALLAGTKTQTRRIVKPQPGRVFSPGDVPVTSGELYAYATLDEGWMLVRAGHQPRENALVGRCPYGVPGDVLWVREAFTCVPASAYRMSEGVQQTVNPDDPYEAAIYAAGWDRSIPKWKPSIHMPRWASRITLRITDVRVERLNDISEANAKAEGIVQLEPPAHNGRRNFGVENMGPDVSPVCNQPTAGRAYRFLWERINGSGSWDANPWVWAVSFERVDQAKKDLPHA
jgi:hypothetical protein